ncbi:hypothetical protein QE359_001499 [Curtobacterium sp. SORGH_AS776]|nr:hypothetical protein [Curtobacterium sp. SORGH_AS_0776]
MPSFVNARDRWAATVRWDRYTSSAICRLVRPVEAHAGHQEFLRREQVRSRRPCLTAGRQPARCAQFRPRSHCPRAGADAVEQPNGLRELFTRIDDPSDSTEPFAQVESCHGQVERHGARCPGPDSGPQVLQRLAVVDRQQPSGTHDEQPQVRGVGCVHDRLRVVEPPEHRGDVPDPECGLDEVGTGPQCDRAIHCGSRVVCERVLVTPLVNREECLRPGSGRDDARELPSHRDARECVETNPGSVPVASTSQCPSSLGERHPGDHGQFQLLAEALSAVGVGQSVPQVARRDPWSGTSAERSRLVTRPCSLVEEANTRCPAPIRQRHVAGFLGSEGEAVDDDAVGRLRAIEEPVDRRFVETPPGPHERQGDVGEHRVVLVPVPRYRALDGRRDQFPDTVRLLVDVALCRRPQQDFGTLRGVGPGVGEGDEFPRASTSVVRGHAQHPLGACEPVLNPGVRELGERLGAGQEHGRVARDARSSGSLRRFHQPVRLVGGVRREVCRASPCDRGLCRRPLSEGRLGDADELRCDGLVEADRRCSTVEGTTVRGADRSREDAMGCTAPDRARSVVVRGTDQRVMGSDPVPVTPHESLALQSCEVTGREAGR